MSEDEIGRFRPYAERHSGGMAGGIDVKWDSDLEGDWVLHSDHKAALAERDAEIERLKEQLEAALVYAGVLAIEVTSMIGLAMAHGFQGHPEHAALGESIRDTLGLTHDEVKAKGRAALDASESAGAGRKDGEG